MQVENTENIENRDRAGPSLNTYFNSWNARNWTKCLHISLTRTTTFVKPRQFPDMTVSVYP